MKITFKDIVESKPINRNDLIAIMNSVTFLNKIYYLPVAETDIATIDRRSKEFGAYKTLCLTIEEAIYQLYHHHDVDYREDNFSDLLNPAKMLSEYTSLVKNKFDAFIRVGLRLDAIQDIVNKRYPNESERIKKENQIIEKAGVVISIVDDLIGDFLNYTTISSQDKKIIEQTIYYPIQTLEWILRVTFNKQQLDNVPYILEKYNNEFIKTFKEKLNEYLIFAHSIDGK